jgi:propionyl-CoA carboxylase alpha chain
VVRIDVSEGDEVFDGQALAMVEAMKMENVLRAERRARVARVRARPGDSLAVDDVILEFE